MKSIKLFLTTVFTYLLILGMVNGQSSSILPNSISIEHTNGTETVRIDGQEGNGGSQINLKNESGKTTIQIDAQGGANLEESSFLQMYNALGNSSLILHSDVNQSKGSRILLQNDANEPAIILDAMEGTTNGAQLELANYAGESMIILDAEYGITGGAMEVFNSNRQRTILLEAEDGKGGAALIEVNGKLIIEGSDFSENFSVTNKARTPIEAGTLLCIDPNNEAKLKVSHQAYDQLIAGIVSGAGGVRAGMIMGQTGTLADGDTPVAISGRVYVKAEATQRAIQPGDLLTSSTIAGHAMKIKNYRKAKGAIIGKALTSLSKGEKGLVLVLVNLQ